ncbi:LLM class flavin-dependent oxidoreductase [Conexibacter sp. DBS9H8]|uniref:LLM class flavin-dependent oxidoreductase n=1 Tax=Conexibacter sp. DBS9H8 TaxID=2937801 RepID=UPI0020107C2E|nr:TIGR03619 family F420-dependent LLM class oxidoreductase [Conexibacter sp. DBS9H8]
MRVGDIAIGRAGDKGPTLDLSVVARDAVAYELIARELTDTAVMRALGASAVTRYELPGLWALKFVVPGILGEGIYSSMKAGMHWQKTAISALLDVELPRRNPGIPLVCVRPPGWTAPHSGGLFAGIRNWARRAEELGFDGLFLGDRMLASARGSEHSTSIVYGASMLEVTTTLAALAGDTERLLLGPLVLVLPYRHPIQMAKTLSTLDVISDGRLILGAGLGWNDAEFAALELPRSERGRRFEESLSLCRALWRGECVSHAGTWAFDDVALSPLPVQPGGPPVWMASFSPGSKLDWSGDVPESARRPLDRIGRLADGYVPLVYSASGKRRLEPVVLGRAWERVLEAAHAAGRGRRDIDFVYSDWVYVIEDAADEANCRAALDGFFDGSWEEAQATYLIGSAEDVAARIAEQAAHIDRIDAYVLTPLGPDAGQLDGLAEVRTRLGSQPVPTT